MLYDCRKDFLVPGYTLWDCEDLISHIDERTHKSNSFDIVTSESIDDKSSALNVEASLKASFLSGLVEVEGSAKYLNDIAIRVLDVVGGAIRCCLSQEFLLVGLTWLFAPGDLTGGYGEEERGRCNHWHRPLSGKSEASGARCRYSDDSVACLRRVAGSETQVSGQQQANE
ncbi:Neoverrucotoxin subunit beta [Liparis tanakae]|uniref:Neoverrucotoxin subunit beta n=1 Tax=Liparis tanakae TaxID=230148 RepID=A0A4Z2J333_9TELE|nr:Neoverrucotoxin subunit beta [Liparis tanakae]